MGNIGLIQTKI